MPHYTLTPCARVSTEDQGQGWSIEEQLDRCQGYIGKLGAKATEPIIREASGGSSKRDDIDQGLDWIRTGRTKGLVWAHPDRFSRNLAVSLIAREQIKQAGGELHFVTSGKYEATPDQKFRTDLDGVLAELERERIKERTSSGRDRKAMAGQWVGNGMQPYGYMRVDGQLVIDDYEAGVVRLMFDLYAQGWSCRQIASELTRLGHPTPAERKGVRWAKNLNNGKWNQNSINQLLGNTAYKGVIKWRGKIDIPVPAIVTEAQWDRVRDRDMKGPRVRMRKYYTLFKGVMACRCGRIMWSEVNNKILKKGSRLDKYYRCSMCGHYINASWVDDQAWLMISRHLSDEKKVRAMIKSIVDGVGSARKEIEQTITVIEGLVAENQNQIIALVTALSRAKAGSPVAIILESRIPELEAEYERLTGQLAAHKLELEQHVGPADIERIHEVRKAILKGMDNATDEEKYRIGVLLGLSGREFENGDIEISFSGAPGISLGQRTVFQEKVFLIRLLLSRGSLAGTHAERDGLIHFEIAQVDV